MADTKSVKVTVVEKLPQDDSGAVSMQTAPQTFTTPESATEAVSAAPERKKHAPFRTRDVKFEEWFAGRTTINLVHDYRSEGKFNCVCGAGGKFYWTIQDERGNQFKIGTNCLRRAGVEPPKIHTKKKQPRYIPTPEDEAAPKAVFADELDVSRHAKILQFIEDEGVQIPSPVFDRVTDHLDDNSGDNSVNDDFDPFAGLE